MKTIINITLGGRSIAIEDTAYEKIKSYTESLQQYYKNEQGRDEIISDIEGRFSELMHEKMRKGAAHITDADVEEMIATMGRPEDFDKATAEATTENSSYTGPNFTLGEKRRLYRDESNKMVGGVCSGIANWLNMDPTVVRVLFAIISFGGFGSGFLIYAFLWIFLPAKNMNVYHGKRMFRNADDKIIGGVAGGMGAYFNTNPNTIRWILAIPLLLSALKGVHFFGWNDGFNFFPNLFFGGLSGTFIFAYIVLWIVLPQALSPYEKMEMYGKTVDVNTIKENVQNTMTDLNERMKNWGKEVQTSAQKLGKKGDAFSTTRSREFSREFGPANRSNRGVGYIIAMLFKAFFVFVAGTIAISLFVAFLAFLLSGFAWAPVNNFLWTSDQQQMWGWGTLLFFIGAPIVGLLVWLIRNILSIKTPGNYLSYLFGGLWTVGWICVVMFVASLSKDLKRIETVRIALPVAQPADGKMLLTVNEPALEYHGEDYEWLHVNNEIKGLSLTADTLKMSTTHINFEKSEDSLYHVLVRKEALGKTDAEARNRAGKIQYNVTAQAGVLNLPNGFAIDKNSKYRFQNVSLTVQVPVGKKIRLDPSVKDKLSDGQIIASYYYHGWGRPRSEKRERLEGDLYRYRSDVDYTMMENGSLKSEAEQEADDTHNGDVYRWDESTPAAPATSVPPAAPGNKDSATVYRYDAPAKANNAATTTKAEIKKELEQKQKELDELKKQLEQ